MASVLDLIGQTPLVEVTRIDCGPCRLFLKLESTNPSGSLKDRPARTMIEAAEADGRLKPGGTIVEATAGNTGLGLALVGGRKGYRTLLVVPDKMVREKVLHAKAMGAEVIITRSDVGKGHPDYYQDVAAAITQRTPGAYFVDQFGNPANPRSHEMTTGPEIFRQMDGDVDAIVMGVGSGGTLTGIGRYMKKASPKTAMILADPEGSILAPLVNTGIMPQVGSWAVEGIGEDFVPPNCDLSLVSAAYAIPDQESFDASRHLLRAEGILAGSSSGTLLAAALRYCRAQTSPKRVVTLVCDSRRQVSVEGVQSDISGSGRLDPSEPARHRGRRGHPSLQRRYRRRGTAAGQPAHRVRADAFGRCLAASGGGRKWPRGRPDRRKRRARGTAYRSGGRR